MWTILSPVLYGLLIWWLSTGGVLAILRVVDRAPRAAVGASALVFALALWALEATAASTGIAAAYAAFTAAIVAWGVQEMAFLAGWITGPWRTALPAGSRGWSRLRYAVAAIIYHELALAASGLAILAVTAGGANQVGAWTFGVLFAMRISAKLNVFLGVPNLTEGFLPSHLGYLKSFFARKPMNLLFPVSVTISTIALVRLADAAATADDATVTALALLATLVGLGLLEHWFLVLPLPVEAMWRWSQDPRAAAVELRPAPAVAAGNVVRLDALGSSRAAARASLGAPDYIRAAADARPATRSD